MKPLVSVIVPVYNVEDSLLYCLDSLSKQSLSNIEVLLIDDASSDRCGNICDEHVKKDVRFRVFHNKSNQGLSVARNIGIKLATSDWLMFVDGDDWVSEDFCEAAYESAISFQVDLVLFKFKRIEKIDNFKGIEHNEENKGSGYKTRVEAIDLLHKEIGQNAWSKLYRKELFNDISYPPGFLYEDMGTTYKIVWKATRIYYLDKILYYYCYRANSITTLKTEKSLHDKYELLLQQYRDLSAWGYPKNNLDMFLKNVALSYCIKKKIDHHDKYYSYFESVLCPTKNIPFFFTWRQIFLFVLFKYCRPLFEFVCVLYNKKIC